MAGQMTERQREIRERLIRGMTVREIAEEDGTTRNAIYQQIQKMRRNGDVDPMYTPTGQLPREKVATISQSALANVPVSVLIAELPRVPASALIDELHRRRDELNAILPA